MADEQTQNSREAHVYFYQTPLVASRPRAQSIKVSPVDPSQREIGFIFTPQYCLDVLVGGAILDESHFLGTGNLQVTREIVADYGRKIGRALSKEGILKCVLHVNRKFDGRCLHPADSKVSYHDLEFKKWIESSHVNVSVADDSKTEDSFYTVVRPFF
jgi:hypothetical protein